MREVQKRQPSSMERMPIELVRMILSSLSDVESLRAAVISCPVFYHAFRNAEKSITGDVLLNQIDVSVLPDAMAARESSELFDPSKKEGPFEIVTGFITQTIRPRPTPPRSWSLIEALRLARVHRCVERLTNQFAQVTLSTGRAACNTPPGITLQERHRIQRALYRFEVYRNLFGLKYIRMFFAAFLHDDNHPLLKFFGSFAPWEIEQLGCVHDFLVGAVWSVSNPTLALSHARIKYSQWMSDSLIQNVLSLGLQKVDKIIRTEIYEECEQDRLLPHESLFYLTDGFRHANKESHGFWLRNTDPNVDLLHIKQPLYADPDSGPADIWRWAHYRESWHNWVYQENRETFRRWGYVMWDRSRLDAIGIFQNPWKEMDEVDAMLKIDEEEEEWWQQMKDMGTYIFAPS
ncbi:hypothetical protein F5Y03DRAFT_404932 [Xylaria venustula]|nr:hypothetical protein F5Y03DRAFT_404932 [Xylaria venustula]